MQALAISPRTFKHLIPTARAAVAGVFGFVRRQEGFGAPPSKNEALNVNSVLLDAHRSMRCGNHVRSWRVLSEWLKSRGDQPEDHSWLAAQIFNWPDLRIVSRLTEARVTRLLTLRQSADALNVVAQRLAVDPRFRPASAADTLSVAQIAARSGAQRIARALLMDFGARFASDPRVSIAEALKRRLTQPAPARMRA